MEVNEQETFSVSCMLYLSEAFDDDDTIKSSIPSCRHLWNMFYIP